MKQNEEDDLALFVEVRKDDLSLLHNSDEFEVPPGSKPGSSPIFKIVSCPTPPRKTLGENFLNMDGDKNDYDWLLTPPGSPFITSPEIKSQKTITTQTGTPKTCPSELKSRFADCQLEHTPNQISSPSLNSSSAGSSRPSSSDSRASTLSNPKSSKPSRPTSKPMPPSTKPVTSTTTRPKPPSCKSTPRSGTPTRLPSNPSPTSNVSIPPKRSSSVGKWGPKTTKTPSEMTKRPVSTSKSRRGGTNPNEEDDVSPVQMGTKMVERMVNSRKLAPPKQDKGSSGFGRTLSKSSLDMALRHMDIGRSIPGNLRQVKSKAPASSIKSGMVGSKLSMNSSNNDINSETM